MRPGDLRGGHVGELVEAHICRTHREGTHRLPRRKSPEIRYADLDDETTTGLEMRGDVLETRDLLVLRVQVGDRVVDEIGEAERAVGSGRGEVADGHRDVIRARLRPELRDHGRRQVDAVHAYAALAERQRDSSGADPELEGGAVAGQLDEEAHRGLDDRRIEHGSRRDVVALGYPFVEVDLRHDGTVPPGCESPATIS